MHFKNTRETGYAIQGMKLNRAKQYLEAVLEHKEIIPFVRFRLGVKPHAQVKNAPKQSSQGRWPEKSCRFLLALLKNAEANADVKGLDTENLVVNHIQVNKAMRGRRRTYRAHGRINAFMSQPCHVELFLTEKDDNVPAGKGKGRAVVRGSGRMRSGTRA